MVQIYRHCRMFYNENVGSRFLQNNVKLLPDCTVSHARRGHSWHEASRQARVEVLMAITWVTYNVTARKISPDDVSRKFLWSSGMYLHQPTQCTSQNTATLKHFYFSFCIQNISLSLLALRIQALTSSSSASARSKCLEILRSSLLVMSAFP